MNQNAGVFENALCGLGISHEVWGEPALVEAHAFHKVQSGLEALAFFDFNHAVCTNSVNGLSDHATQFAIVVGGNRGHLLKIIHLLAWLGEFVHSSAGHFGGGHHTTLDSDGVCTSCHLLEPLFQNGVGQHGGGSGPVARNIGGLLGHLVHHLGAHVLEGVGEFNFSSHTHTVFGDRRAAE